MRSVGKFLISPYPFLSEQVRISTAETGWTELIMNINQQFVFGSQTNHIMQPSSPTMTGILYETGFHTYDSPLMQQWKKLMHLFHQGMLIDIHVIFGQGDALKVAAVMITVALVGKWIASWLTQKIYRMAPIERELMFGLSNAQAAATLAAVLVGYNIILPGGERC